MAAYDKGFVYEEDLQAADANTYNRVNRLVGRVLLDPRVLEPGAADSAEVADGLEVAEKIVTEEIRSTRRKDPWAYCDLGTIQLLRGEPEALATFHRLVRMRPQGYVYESTLTTLEPLPEVASDLRPEFGRLSNCSGKSRSSAPDPVPLENRIVLVTCGSSVVRRRACIR